MKSRVRAKTKAENKRSLLGDYRHIRQTNLELYKRLVIICENNNLPVVLKG